jgi:hypothetical protein
MSENANNARQERPNATGAIETTPNASTLPEATAPIEINRPNENTPIAISPLATKPIATLQVFFGSCILGSCSEKNEETQPAYNGQDHQVAAMIFPLSKRTIRRLWCIRLILIMASLGEAVSPIRSMPENSSVADV